MIFKPAAPDQFLKEIIALGVIKEFESYATITNSRHYIVIVSTCMTLTPVDKRYWTAQNLY